MALILTINRYVYERAYACLVVRVEPRVIIWMMGIVDSFMFVGESQVRFILEW
jgi:hypothetical protein